jgi:hypothetical protein
MLFAISFSSGYRVCKRTAWIFIRLRGCAGWSGSMLVANPLCWFCHGAAHIIFSTMIEYSSDLSMKKSITIVYICISWDKNINNCNKTFTHIKEIKYTGPSLFSINENIRIDVSIDHRDVNNCFSTICF